MAYGLEIFNTGQGMITDEAGTCQYVDYSYNNVNGGDDLMSGEGGYLNTRTLFLVEMGGGISLPSIYVDSSSQIHVSGAACPFTTVVKGKLSGWQTVSWVFAR